MPATGTAMPTSYEHRSAVGAVPAAATVGAHVAERVIAAGTFDPNLARNRTLLALLARAGYEVVTCQVDLWGADRYEIPNQRKLGVVLHDRGVSTVGVAIPPCATR